jgi:hypothetical protein
MQSTCVIGAWCGKQNPAKQPGPCGPSLALLAQQSGAMEQ